MSEDDPIRSITFAIRSSLLVRIDAHGDVMKKKMRGVDVTRTDALKNLIEVGLTEVGRAR